MKSRLGLKGNSINWSDVVNLCCFALGSRGMHAKTISQYTGLTVGQVHLRCQKLGLKLRDYRDGKGPSAKLIVQRFGASTVNRADMQILKLATDSLVRFENKKLKKIS